MPKNRDYTGLERTPSSMAWLIRARSIAKGKLDRLIKLQGDLPAQIARAEADVSALDCVIPLHDVPVDPASIKGTRRKSKALFPHGLMTKGILNCLKIANGAPLGSVEIAVHVAKFGGIPITPANKMVIRVSRRLKEMVRGGGVVRHHEKITQEYGQWSLAPHVLED